MRLAQAWIIATKDFAMFRKKRNILYSTFVLPVLLTGLLSGVVAEGPRDGELLFHPFREGPRRRVPLVPQLEHREHPLDVLFSLGRSDPVEPPIDV